MPPCSLASRPSRACGAAAVPPALTQAARDSVRAGGRDERMVVPWSNKRMTSGKQVRFRIIARPESTAGSRGRSPRRSARPEIPSIKRRGIVGVEHENFILGQNAAAIPSRDREAPSIRRLGAGDVPSVNGQCTATLADHRAGNGADGFQQGHAGRQVAARPKPRRRCRIETQQRQIADAQRVGADDEIEPDWDARRRIHTITGRTATNREASMPSRPSPITARIPRRAASCDHPAPLHPGGMLRS